jgi:RiboL-PSP-HEPN
MHHRERDHVKQVLKLAADLPVEATELRGHWGRYACIVCSGYLETALRIVIQIKVDAKASPEICAYVRQSLKSIQNPKADRFTQVLGSFDSKWKSQLDAFFDANQDVKNAIDSIMSNRHLIAHGKSCSVSIAQVTTYFYLADKAVDFIDNLLNKNC